MPVYRVEDVQRLLDADETVLRLVRHFGPPRDHPHAVLETVRKQLPIGRAVYKLECFRQPPRLPASSGLVREKSILLRIAADSVSFLDLTGLSDERCLVARHLYFGVDDAPAGARQLSPNLGIPYADIDAWVGNRWCRLSRPLLENLAGRDTGRNDDLNALWASRIVGRCAGRT